jgi:hypothetical protein
MCQNIYAAFPDIILLHLLPVWYVRHLFCKLQGCTVKELYETGTVTQGFDTQKKLAEEAITIHSRASRQSEGYNDLDIGISTLYSRSKGMGLCTSF